MLPLHTLLCYFRKNLSDINHFARKSAIPNLTFRNKTNHPHFNLASSTDSLNQLLVKFYLFSCTHVEQRHNQQNRPMEPFNLGVTHQTRFTKSRTNGTHSNTAILESFFQFKSKISVHQFGITVCRISVSNNFESFFAIQVLKINLSTLVQRR